MASPSCGRLMVAAALCAGLSASVYALLTGFTATDEMSASNPLPITRRSALRPVARQSAHRD